LILVTCRGHFIGGSLRDLCHRFAADQQRCQPVPVFRPPGTFVEQTNASEEKSERGTWNTTAR